MYIFHMALIFANGFSSLNVPQGYHLTIRTADGLFAVAAQAHHPGPAQVALEGADGFAAVHIPEFDTAVARAA